MAICPVQDEVPDRPSTYRGGCAFPLYLPACGVQTLETAVNNLTL